MGASWVRLGSVLGVLEVSWASKKLVKPMKNHHFSVWYPLGSWAVLWPSWGRLGASWVRLGGILGRLGASWERLGSVLGASWGRLGPSWVILENLGAS